MSYPRWGDRWYRVVVRARDGRTWVRVGEYSNTPNAVFGVMRKLRLDRELDTAFNLDVEVLPPKPPNMAKAAYTRQLRQSHEFGAAPN